MEEKLVKVLLDQYKEKGIDMYALLDDNFFKDLNLPTKVDLIKKYASHISSGTSRTLSKKDIGAIVLDAGFAGILTGVTAGMAAREAGKFFTKGITPIGAMAGAVALGAAMSAGSSYLGSRKKIQQRADIIKRLDATVKNPTDENALGVLTARNIQLNPIARVSINSSTAAHLNNTAQKIPSMIMQQVDPVVKYRSFKHNYKNQTNEYASGVTQAEYEHYYNQSGKDMVKSFNDSIENMRQQILKRDK